MTLRERNPGVYAIDVLMIFRTFYIAQDKGNVFNGEPGRAKHCIALTPEHNLKS